ncbi:MAG: 23S rRNA (adenine(2503)-C(2))-methyltransferase RlmN [Candidatus Omnitrophota bacterium]
MKSDICNYSKRQLEEVLGAMGHPKYRARQVFRWLYKKGVLSFDRMNDLSPALRVALSGRFYIGTVQVKDTIVSKKDDTVKYLFELRDSNVIETAYIPQERRATVCLSSQAGCKYGCAFCASAQAGFVRDLTVSEIVRQVLYIKFEERLPVTNIVFMGVGEPFDNYDNVVASIRTLNDPEGPGIGARKITVSTCGLVPKIREFSREGFQVELSVSLHSAIQSVRSRLVPVNRAHPLEKLIGACREYTRSTNRIITFEYVLIDGVNDSKRDAAALIRLLRGMKCKVNLIAQNRTNAPGCKPSDGKIVTVFADTLTNAGITSTVRRPRGSDIDAGCGQLRINYDKNNK